MRHKALWLWGNKRKEGKTDHATGWTTASPPWEPRGGYETKAPLRRSLPPTRYMFAAMAAPGPWLPLQVEGWLSSRSRCRSCVLENGGLINTKQTGRETLKGQRTSSRTPLKKNWQRVYGGQASRLSVTLTPPMLPLSGSISKNVPTPLFTRWETWRHRHVQGQPLRDRRLFCSGLLHMSAAYFTV